MRRRLWLSLILTVLIVGGALGANLATGNTPILGIDLAGGVSVILAPTEDASSDDLTIVRDLVRDELERRGIAEPDVRVQGETIVVELPGVDDQQEAIDAVQVSGIVELRPVLGSTSCSSGPTTDGVTVDPPATDGVTVDPATSDGVTLDPPSTEASTDDLPVSDAPTTDAATDDPPSSDAASDDPSSSVQPLLRPLGTPADESPTASTAPDTAPSDSVPPGTDAPTSEPPTTGDIATVDPPTDDAGADDPLAPLPPSGGPELLPTRDGFTVCVGPDQNTGDVLVFARGGSGVVLDPTDGWMVVAELRGGEGEAYWNSLARQCVISSPSPTCSAGQLAIVLDGVVQSAPTVRQADFDDEVSITGAFTESEARSLASVLNRGAFPVQVEAEEARTVSASAGGDSLRAAVIAGLIGLALVLTFLLAYYRWLALVILGGLAIWSATVYSVATFVSDATNYALSLAGITGIIVAIGVTVDSYVVFFERMKDEIRNGRTLKNAGPRSFTVTWRTIWTADLVSVLGATILFWLSVGSVRGFALYLGITTLCDLFVCYFFTRPAVILLARSRFMQGRKAFGLEVAS